MTWSDWAQLGGTLTLGLVALLVATLGPYLADIGRRLFLAPRVIVEFDESQRSLCHITKSRYDSGPPPEEYPVYYFRFSVRNNGRSVARSCEVVLEEIYECGQADVYKALADFWQTNLKWESGGLQVDINPKRPALFADIGHICHPEAQDKYERSQSVSVPLSDTRLRFIIDLHFRHFAKADSLPQGVYRLKIVVVGENFEPVEKWFTLSWSGKWTENENQMLGEEAVLAIQ